MRVHLHRLKHADDLAQASRERVELAEDVHLGELEPLHAVRLSLQLFLRPVEAALVGVVEGDAALKTGDDDVLGLRPDALHPPAAHVRLARRHHLIRHLAPTMHGLGGVSEGRSHTKTYSERTGGWWSSRHHVSQRILKSTAKVGLIYTLQIYHNYHNIIIQNSQVLTNI